MIEYINRRGSNCCKWDSEPARGNLPLWIADMDFKAAPAIIAAMQRRLDHGVFGYQCVPQAYYDSIASWFSRRHGWNGIARENIIYTTGVVPAISAVLRAVKDKIQADRGQGAGVKVLTLTPAYNCFFSSIRNLGCELLPCPLCSEPDGGSCNEHYFTVDFAGFERQAAEADVFLLCNPHNPTGRVWTRDELTRMARICEEHGVFVISDEIHCEFTFPGVSYTPYATVAQGTGFCICTSTSKAFNIAGLQCANIFVLSSEWYALIDRTINIHEVCDINPFGMTALMAAYNDSEEWLDELQRLIYRHYTLVCSFLKEHLPMLRVTRMEGTYLAWVDVTALLAPANKPVCACSPEAFRPTTATELCDDLAKRQHVLFNPSEMYGAEGFLRINIATSEDVLLEALGRLKSYVDALPA